MPSEVCVQSSEQPRTEIWSTFVRAALALGIVGGFGLGGLLFAAIALRLPLGAWWTAAAQAHGQVQSLGWAGLTVIGVALHFLPRLRGAAPSRPVLALPALALLVAGLLLRLICQPLLADPPAAWLRPAVRLGLGCAGLFGLVGATLSLAGLARALANGPPLRRREGFRQVAPFLLVTFGCYWAANALTGAGLVATAWRGTGLLDAPLERASTLLALYGFLWPICIAMSARLLPLHVRTALPHHAALRASLACAIVGLALRLGTAFGATTLDGFGQLLLAASLVLAIAGLRVFAPRRPLPRPTPPIVTEPIQVAVLSAYGWLALTALLLGLNGLATLGLPVPAPAGETHAFGAGFVTILILGVGAALFPGFARRPLRSPRLLWAILLAANLAALARVLPPWLGSILPPRLASAALAVAGLCGVLALLFFAANLAGPRPPATKPERNPT
jgi:uncharacterized protein involved in response to NO